MSMFSPPPLPRGQMCLSTICIDLFDVIQIGDVDATHATFWSVPTSLEVFAINWGKVCSKKSKLSWIPETWIRIIWNLVIKFDFSLSALLLHFCTLVGRHCPWNDKLAEFLLKQGDIDLCSLISHCNALQCIGMYYICKDRNTWDRIVIVHSRHCPWDYKPAKFLFPFPLRAADSVS